MKNLTCISPQISHRDILDEEHFKWKLKGIQKRIDWEIPGSTAYEKFSRWATRLRRKLRDTETYNLRYIIKWAMLARPRWRRQVMKDLGGEAALKDWDNRQMQAHVKAETPVSYDMRNEVEISAETRPKSSPHVRQIKTDRFGHFRLAPIMRPKRVIDLITSTSAQAVSPPRPPIRTSQDESDNVDLMELAKQKPIPLLPCELRGETLAVNLAIIPNSDPTFEQRLEIYGNPPAMRRLPYKPIIPIEKPKQAWSFAMAELPEDLFPKRDPP